MKAPIDISREGFAAWLALWEPEDVVGYARTGRACPVASYILAQDPGLTVLVGLYNVVAEPHSYRTPDWASSLAYRVDQTPRGMSGRPTELTARLVGDCLPGFIAPEEVAE